MITRVSRVSDMGERKRDSPLALVIQMPGANKTVWKQNLTNEDQSLQEFQETVTK